MSSPGKVNWEPIKKACLAQIRAEVGASGRSPDYVGIGRTMISNNNWGTTTEVLRQKMRHWWVADQGVDKQRKSAKREQKRKEDPEVVDT